MYITEVERSIITVFVTYLYTLLLVFDLNCMIIFFEKEKRASYRQGAFYLGFIFLDGKIPVPFCQMKPIGQ